MKIFQNKRDESINSYIMFSQVCFFLLIGLLVFRNFGVSFDNYFYKIPIAMVFCIILVIIPFIQRLNFCNKQKNYLLSDIGSYLFYLIFASCLLVKESDHFFNVVLMMPVIMMALKYGANVALVSAVFSSGAVLIVSGIKDYMTIDADIMFSGIMFLLAWLLGNMTETEHNIRKELERLATYDGLTNLYNHRSFQQLMDQEIVKAENNGKNLSLIMLDIDYFKYYNDAFGHQKGDVVLKELADTLRNVIGSLGYCARYGGEEFAVILPGLNIAVAKTLGEEIRKELAAKDFPGKEIFPEECLTVSVGIAEFPLNAQNKVELIKIADEALYRAKFVSKNKVESYYSIFDEMESCLKEDERQLFNSIKAFTMVINAKDRYTYGHSIRVMEMAKMLAVRIELDPTLVQEISFGALLHDIGKVEITREVLNKPGNLNNKEWQTFYQHPIWGADIIDPLKSLKETKSIILYHHENFDGTGYPYRIKGEEIPVGARLLRIIDSFDAMTTKRSYKDAMSPEQALEDLRKYAGTYYDPVLLQQFEEMIWEQIKEEKNEVS